MAAMYRAELVTGMLTAGHDAEQLRGGLESGRCRSPETRTRVSAGREITAAAGDMCIRDEAGIVSSIVYGPDDRTRLGPATSRAVFTTYAPGGIGPEAVRRHFEAIAENDPRDLPSRRDRRDRLVEAVLGSGAALTDAVADRSRHFRGHPGHAVGPERAGTPMIRWFAPSPKKASAVSTRLPELAVRRPASSGRRK